LSILCTERNFILSVFPVCKYVLNWHICCIRATSKITGTHYDSVKVTA
jgi:hypothetical protein